MFSKFAKKGLSVLLAVALCASAVVFTNTKTVQAATPVEYWVDAHAGVDAAGNGTTDPALGGTAVKTLDYLFNTVIYPNNVNASGKTYPTLASKNVIIHLAQGDYALRTTVTTAPGTVYAGTTNYSDSNKSCANLLGGASGATVVFEGVKPATDANGGTRLYSTASANYLFCINALSNVTFENIMLDGTRSLTSASKRASCIDAVNDYGATAGITLKNCAEQNFTGAAGYGFVNLNSANLTIDGLTVNDSMLDIVDAARSSSGTPNIFTLAGDGIVSSNTYLYAACASNELTQAAPANDFTFINNTDTYIYDIPATGTRVRGWMPFLPNSAVAAAVKIAPNGTYSGGTFTVAPKLTVTTTLATQSSAPTTTTHIIATLNPLAFGDVLGASDATITHSAGNTVSEDAAAGPLAVSALATSLPANTQSLGVGTSASQTKTFSGIALTGWDFTANPVIYLSVVDGPYTVDPSYANSDTSNVAGGNVYATEAITPVHFDPNTGSGTMSDGLLSGSYDGTDFTTDAASATFACTFTPPAAGYSFVGWNTAADGSGAGYSTVIPVNAVVTPNMTLFAQWQAQAQAINYFPNGGTGTMNPDSAATGSSFTLTANAFTKAGYDFTGWNTDPAGAGDAYADAATITVPGSPLNLYAQWAAKSYTLTYDGNGADGGSMTAETHFTADVFNLAANAFTLTGYKFTGWAESDSAVSAAYADEGSFTMPAGDVTLYAVWAELQAVAINGGGADGTIPPEYVDEGDTYTVPDATELTYPGYTFAGWQGSDGNTYQPGDEITMPAGGITLTALWSANENTLSFDGNGGAGSMSDIQAATDEVVTLPGNGFTMTGYTFIGWLDPLTGATIPDAGDFTMPATDVTLQAQWQIDTEAMTFAANGGTGTMDPLYADYGSSLVVPDCGFTAPDGYEFDGWLGSDGNTYAPGDEIPMPDGGITLTAQWKTSQIIETMVLITFDPNGGTLPAGFVNSVIKFKGDMFTIPTDIPAYTGYTFMGWSRSTDGTTVVNQPGDTVGPLTSGIWFIAIWSENPMVDFTITFDPNGGNLPIGYISPVLVASGQAFTISTDEPTRDGYTFLGWSLDGKTVVYMPGDTIDPVTGDMLLIAVWKQSQIIPPPTPGTPPPPSGGGSYVPSYPPGLSSPSGTLMTYADALFNLGLFVGTVPGADPPVYDLDQPLTRIQALVLVIRLLGLQDEAMAYDGPAQFSDVPDWATKYASFGYAEGITVGVNDEHTLFAPNRQVTFQEFTAFLLRVLGYYEKNGDFQYDQTLAEAVQVGLYTSSTESSLSADAPFLRGDAVVAMVNALMTYIKNSKDTMLIDTLVSERVFSQSMANAFEATIKAIGFSK